MPSVLDKRLTKLVTRNYARHLEGYFPVDGLGDIEDPEELGYALLRGWQTDGLGGYDMGELDGLLKKIGKSLKRTLVTAPLKALKATVTTLKTGSLKPMVSAIKEEVKAVKEDVKTALPIAAVVANVIPGVGQVVSVGLTAAAAALKAKETMDKQKAAQKAAEAQAAAQAAADAQVAAQAAATQQAQEQAIKDAQVAQEAAIAAQNQAAAAQTQAIMTAQAGQQLQMAASQGLIQPGMTAQQVGTAVAQSSLMGQGYNFSSPEAQSVLSDQVEAYQPVVAADDGTPQAASFGDPKTLLIAGAVLGGLYLFSRRRKRASR